jgi:XTP/dITP diphosphohydrolase
VAANWEVLKKKEKGRESITDGIPNALPALALVAKLQRKAQAAGVLATDVDRQAQLAARALAALRSAASGATSLEGATPTTTAVGDLLEAVVSLAQFAGVDPEAALRAKAVALRSAIRTAEGVDSVG